MRRERSLLVKAAPRGLCLLLYQIKAAWAQHYNHGDSEKALLTAGRVLSRPQPAASQTWRTQTASASAMYDTCCKAPRGYCPRYSYLEIFGSIPGRFEAKGPPATPCLPVPIPLPPSWIMLQLAAHPAAQCCRLTAQHNRLANQECFCSSKLVLCTMTNATSVSLHCPLHQKDTARIFSIAKLQIRGIYVKKSRHPAPCLEGLKRKKNSHSLC